MFKIEARDFRYQNFTVSAFLDLIIEENLIFYREEFSLSDSVPLLLDTITLDHIPADSHQDGKMSLFICSCGNANCNYFDCKIEHKKNFVIISEVKKKGENKFKNLTFTIPFKEYAREIVNLAKELLNFENILKKMISDATFYRYFEKKKGVAEKLDSLKNLYPEIFEEEKEIDEDIEIEEFLKKVDLKKAIKIVKRFPWKEEELIRCLMHPQEVIRYKSAEILGLLSSKMAVPKLIETLIDESEAVRYSVSEALSRIGFLKTLQFMDELYLKRKFSRGCQRGKIKGENLKKSDAILPLSALLKEEDEEILERTLKTIEKLFPLKEKRITESLSEFVKDKNKNSSLRIQAIVLLSNIEPLQSIYPLMEILKDREEKEEVKEIALKKLLEKESFEVNNFLQEFSECLEEERLRKICNEYLVKKEFKKRIFSPFSATVFVYFLFFLIPVIFFIILNKTGFNLFLNILICILLTFLIIYISFTKF